MHSSPPVTRDMCDVLSQLRRSRGVLALLNSYIGNAPCHGHAGQATSSLPMMSGVLPIYDITDLVAHVPVFPESPPPSATMGAMVSEIFDPERWRPVEGFSFTDITYHRAVGSGTVRVAFDRPEVRNAFRPHTVDELYVALDHARMSGDVGCVLLTGNGPSRKDGGWAFCSGGDQRIRGRD